MKPHRIHQVVRSPMHTGSSFWRRASLSSALVALLAAGSVASRTPLTIVQVAADQHVLVLTSNGEVWG